MKKPRQEKQLCLAVRRYRVRVEGFTPYETDAGSPSQAKWRAFKAAREAGYFRDGCFLAFLLNVDSVSEVRL